MANYGSISPSIIPAPQKTHHLTQAERDLLQSDRPGYGTRSKVEVAFNLVNATVGAGIIGLPFAIGHAGFILGLFISVFVAILSQLGLYMVVLAGQRAGIYKFAQLVEHIMGRFGYHFLNSMIIIQAGGACISYFILLGDTMPILLEPYFPQFAFVSTRTLVVCLIAVFGILPLNMARSIGSLARWSIVSVMLFPVVVLTIVIRAPSYMPDEPIPVSWVGSDVFGALGVFAFAFTCSQVAFNNYLTLEDQSSRSWRHATSMSTGISWAISMVFAILGYFCFGAKVQPNLFTNFPNDDLVINIGRFILGCTMVLTIPLGFYPTREAVQKVLGFETNHKQPTDTQHYTVTFVLFAVLLGLGISIRSLGKVYGLVGGISATTLAFILPSIAYLYTTKPWFQSSHRPSWTNTLTPRPSVSPSIVDDKMPLLWEVTSTASSSRTPYSYVDDEDVSTVDGAFDEAADEDDLITSDYIGSPNRFLDGAAVVLFIWGILVMFLSCYSVLVQAN
ncbi:transmembrane amino acid transporter protein-domain-containing protein [Gongronella butleri]|nr:transmembrane amino acid transporter protein-domain-containing protein [Gongronella butleri]